MHHTQTEEHKRKNSEGLKRYWADKKRREQQSEMMKKVWSDVDQREQRSASMKETWANPDSTFNTEEYRSQVSESMTKEWSKSDSSHRTEQFRQKNSESNRKTWSDTLLRQRHSDAMKRLWEDESLRIRASARVCSSETKARISVARRGQPPSDEHRRKNSEGVKRAWALGRKLLSDNFRGSGVHNGVWMRCLNSEGVLARELDESGIEWVYEPKRFKLSSCTYLPDFYLPEFDIWVEVKGWMSEVSQRKIDLFRCETGKTLVVVMQTELSSLLYPGGV